ncbi:hypothetical protein HHL23_20460 [Chryseobacterium sp. RP-3-3]|uniref:Uncharacterized protein n=1 Tax=Chryseobacterium antibioticum TaxID=2728847 RepID=A0A7Y0ARJ1_9FLAO|nr:hypothetical protein [Chryseobacterium antibioticum]NML72142.1 hypothetical protein [Chryseobacterium antibioticum]
MKKQSFLMLLLSAFLFFGCRQESLYVDQELQNNSPVSKNYVINDAEIKKDAQLWSKLSGIQAGLFGSDPKAKNNDPLLDGAVIMTDYAGVVEKNGITTYTFQIKRIYPSKDTENLVVRKNADGSYSGLLIQYHLSKQEIQAFQNAGKPQDIKGKISAYTINDININSKNGSGGYTYSEQIGCLVVNYEIIPCTSSDQHTNPNQCALTGVDAPQIILMSVDDTHCNPSGNPGGSGTGSGPGGTQGGGSGVGSTTPTEFLYNTFLFTDFGDAYNICAAGDSQCEANRQLNIELQAYLLTLPPPTSMLSSYLHTYLTVKGYFKLNGGTSFLTDRLSLMAGWYNNPANASIPYTERDKFVNWGLNFLIQNPDVTWTRFENWFLEETLNNTLQNEFLEDWAEPDRVKPTTKFKNHAKLNGIYNKIKTAANFNQILKNFTPEGSVAHLMFDIGAVYKQEAQAETSEPVNYWIKITFNKNKNWADIPKIVIAQTFIHELIHAEILRQLLAVANSNGSIDEATLLDYAKNHKNIELFNAYVKAKTNDADFQHQFMAQKYVTTIVNFLKQVYGNQYTDVEYKTVAWMSSLKGTKAWNLLPQSEKDLYINTFNTNYWLWEL